MTRRPNEKGSVETGAPMTRRTTDQMFGKVVRDMAAQERAEREDARDRARQLAEEEARLDEPLTRREVIDAVETVAFGYECSGSPQSDMIAAAFRKLAEALS